MDKDRELRYYKNGFYFYLIWIGIESFFLGTLLADKLIN